MNCKYHKGSEANTSAINASSLFVKNAPLM